MSQCNILQVVANLALVSSQWIRSPLIGTAKCLRTVSADDDTVHLDTLRGESLSFNQPLVVVVVVVLIAVPACLSEFPILRHLLIGFVFVTTDTRQSS